MAAFTIRHAKQRLAAEFPGVKFSYGTAGHGRAKGPSIVWQGEPSAQAVTEAMPEARWLHWHIVRRPTQSETDEIDAQYERERPARKAAAAQAKIDRKAAGEESRRGAVAERKRIATWLAKNYPDTVFMLDRMRGQYYVAWIDGPDEAAIAAGLGLPTWQCDRTMSEAAARAGNLAARQIVRANRTARRLAQSKVRAIRRCHGAARCARLAFEATRQLHFFFLD